MLCGGNGNMNDELENFIMDESDDNDLLWMSSSEESMFYQSLEQIGDNNNE